jgi:hypothetical protein
MGFAFDLTELINPDKPFVNAALKRRLHIVTEYKLSPLVVRAGVTSGYPALGGGLAPDIINTECVFYREEKEAYTNLDPV